MKRKTVITLIVIVAISIYTAFNYYNAYSINPTDFEIRYLDLNNSKIPDSFDGCTIAFISDIEFGAFFNEERLNKFKDTIDDLQIDMLIFGGDLFDRNYSPVSDDINLLTEVLSNINAPFGKFAILGDFDQTSEQRTALVKKILNDAEFELLNNNPLVIHYNTGEFINLIGIDYSEDMPDISNLFNNIDSQQYTITVVHGAEFAKNLPAGLSNLTLSGHSHHMQINLPFFINYEDYRHNDKTGIGKFNLDNTLLYVTRGIGTTKTDCRFFSDPEIIYFRIKK